MLVTLCGSLALLAWLLTAALLLAGLLTRRLILLAGLVLVCHVVSFRGEHRDNGSESAPFRKNKSGNSHCRHYVTFSLTYSGLHPSLIGYATTAYA
jgi:hypothetical protein